MVVEVRHNTKPLEYALEDIARRAALPGLQAEAAAQKEQSRAIALRRIATGAAVGLAALGIGAAIALLSGMEPKLDDKIALEADKSEKREGEEPELANKSIDQEVSENKKEKISREVDVAPPKTPAPEPEENRDSYVTTDFSIFRRMELKEFGYSWVIEAGHSFKTEADQAKGIWSSAWCYTNQEVKGLSLKLDLARRNSPNGPPLIHSPKDQTLEALGLTIGNLKYLAESCPWYDGKKFKIPGEVVREF